MEVYTSLQTDNHANTPPLSFFTGRMPFLPPNQQRQSTVSVSILEVSPNSPTGRVTFVPPFQLIHATIDACFINVYITYFLNYRLGHAQA